MPLPAFDELTFRLRRVATQAGAAIMHIYADAEKTDVTVKGDGSPVTAADTAAEAVILPALRTLTPDIPIVSEEEAADGKTPDVGDGPFWLVDPLDGTKEFISRNGEFTVNIALVVDGLPVLGVVFAPALGELFAGHGPGTAVRWTAATGTTNIAVRTPPDAGVTVVGSRSHGDKGKTEDFLTRFKVAEFVSCGSSLKFCTVAAGRADLYPRFGRTCAWDTAAGHAVLAAAGGRVESADGTLLRYLPSPGFYNPEFIAYGKC